MADELPAAEHQVLASSKYAKLIAYASAFMLLALIATDRAQESKIAVRDELIQRRLHADRMSERASLLLSGSHLPLLNICYAALASNGPACQVTDEGEGLQIFEPDDAPVGILGDYKSSFTGDVKDNRWNLASSDVLNILDALSRKLAPLIAEGQRDEIVTLLDATVSDLSKKSKPAPQTRVPEDQDVRDLAATLLQTGQKGLTEKEAAWLVTGSVTHLHIDPEYNAKNLALGFVERPHSISDLPVFSVFEFVQMSPSKAWQRVRDYGVEIDKMLQTKNLDETSIEIFGSGINLKFYDGAVFAGMVLALLQMFYVISLAQERKSLTCQAPSSSYAPFPRFSCASDPLRGKWPSTAEQLFETAIYLFVLLAPTTLLFSCWLSHFSLTDLVAFLAHPLELWLSDIDFGRLADASERSAFASSLNVISLAISCYALLRIVQNEGEDSPHIRWPTVGLLWRAAVVTACFATMIGLTGSNSHKPYLLGAVILMAGGTLGYLHEAKKLPPNQLRRVCFWFLLAITLVSLVGGFTSDKWCSFWRPAYFVLPFGNNVLFPIMICCCGFFAAMSHRQRITFWFFLCLVSILSFVALRQLLWLLPF